MNTSDYIKVSDIKGFSYKKCPVGGVENLALSALKAIDLVDKKINKLNDRINELSQEDKEKNAELIKDLRRQMQGFYIKRKIQQIHIKEHVSMKNLTVIRLKEMVDQKIIKEAQRRASNDYQNMAKKIKALMYSNLCDDSLL